MSFGSRAKALKRAREVRAMMRNPKRWKVRVHENIGWHWKLTCRNVMLNESEFEGIDGKKFWTLISDNPDEASYGFPAWSNSSKYYVTPQEAVDAGVAKMKVVAEEHARRFIECIAAAGEGTDGVNAGNKIYAFVGFNQSGQLEVDGQEFDTIEGYHEALSEIIEEAGINPEDLGVLFSSSVDFPNEYTKSRRIRRLAGEILGA